MARRSPATDSTVSRPSALTPPQVALIPILFSAAFAAFIALPPIWANGHLAASFAAAAALLLTWALALRIRSSADGRPLRLEISLRPQHYLQALAHTSIFVYWGFYWDPLRHAAVLIAAQIVFAYAFDMLLSWSRRESYTLGFGPFPIIFSTNLFLRFHDDWFYLQFTMVALGFLAKELIRWNRDGRRVHIFNPSSFPLAIVSLVLILTNSSHVTWAEDIASKLNLAPQIYLFIFLVALPGQFLFRVTTMTLPAAVTVYGFSMLYLKLTGTYFFIDSNIPIAVFLGMHLLFTDPSTSPRSELGRIMFGVLYGATVVGLYWLLGRVGAPTYYDKLLQVPVMNLMVIGLDAVARSRWASWLNPERLGAALAPRLRSLAYVSLWIVAFGALSATKGVGDFHEGSTVPFWQRACSEHRTDACGKLGGMLQWHCTSESGWACNELAILIKTERLQSALGQGELFAKACGYGELAGCNNARKLEPGQADFAHGQPTLLDFPRILRQAKGAIREKTPFQIYTRACDEGWLSGCEGLSGVFFMGSADLVADKPRAASLALRACEGGLPNACANLGLMYKNGDGVSQDRTKALDYLKRACDLGLQKACRWLAEEQSK